MAKRTPHLMKRSGYYYFRFVIPTLLQPKFGRKEFTYSLKTTNPTDAKASCWHLLKMADILMTMVKGNNRLTPEEARELARKYFSEALKRLQKQFDNAEEHSVKVALGHIPPANSSTRDREGYLSETPDLGDIEQADYLLPLSHSNLVTVDLDALLDLNLDKFLYRPYLEQFGRTDIKPGTLSYETFRNAMERAVAELINIHRQMLKHEPDIHIEDNWFTPSSNSSLGAPQLKPHTTLRQMTVDFVAERIRGNEWTLRTRKDRQAQLDLLIEILGEESDLRSLDALKASEVKKSLQQLPKNRRKNPKTRNLTLAEALKVEGVEKLTAKTVNEYLVTYQSLCGWAEEQGLIDKNSFKKLSIRNKSGKKKNRSAFSPEQVQIILAALENHKNDPFKPYRYWGVMIGIYTGARLNEVAQLELKDIKQEGDIWYFDINDDGDDGDKKRLKNAHSTRRVPIHSRIHLV